MLLLFHNLNDVILFILILICYFRFTIEIRAPVHHNVRPSEQEPSHHNKINHSPFEGDTILNDPLKTGHERFHLINPYQLLFNRRLEHGKPGNSRPPKKLVSLLRPNQINSNQTDSTNSHLAPKRKSILFEPVSGNAPVVANATIIVSPTGNLTVDTSNLTKTELDSALYIPGVKCGLVPLFEKLYNRSINETVESEGNFRILHGLDSIVGEWPWMVRISECDEEESCSTCTGTLLNDRWVITAGHCGFNKNDTSKFKATLGLYDLIIPEESSFTVDIDKLIVHPDYNDLSNDLSLIRLAQPVKFNDNIQPACLIRPTKDIVAWTANKVCYNVGYGMIDGMVDALRLQKLKIMGRNATECNSDKIGAVRLKPNTVCIGPIPGQIGGSCRGDSGGPDVCYDAKNGQWVLFGTVSYGPLICDREDGDEWHTVSVDLSKYRTWIEETILKNSL